jgi:predicted RND superfamily exporter protein
VGDVPLNAIYNEVIAGESGGLAGIAFAVIAVLLLFFFRRPLGVIGPLVVVFTSITVCMAFVVLMGWRLDLTFIMLPTLLIAVGVADSVHIIAEFRAYHAELGDRREVARRTLYLVGTACLLTSVITATGFASMAIATIKSIAHLAIDSAVGVLAAFLLTVTPFFVFLSSGRRYRSPASSDDEKLRAKGGRLFQGALAAITRFDIRYPKPILAAFVRIFIVSGFGIVRLRVDSNFVNEFSEEQPIRRSVEFVGDTIHHLTRFDLELRLSGSYHQALYASMSDVGRALVITSVVLVMGFLVFHFSVLDSIASFGSLLATTISVALVADFLLMPALLLIFKPFGPDRSDPLSGPAPSRACEQEPARPAPRATISVGVMQAARVRKAAARPRRRSRCRWGGTQPPTATPRGRCR